jgi:hypothetical protein
MTPQSKALSLGIFLWLLSYVVMAYACFTYWDGHYIGMSFICDIFGISVTAWLGYRAGKKTALAEKTQAPVAAETQIIG